MPPTLAELLKVAKAHDAVIHARHVKINKAIQDAGELVVTAPVPVHELQLIEEDHDPFNGNLNNRRVAARIAREPHQRRSANHSDHVTVGDPTKAAEDVAKSLAVLPDPAIPSGDELPAIELPAPTPGSPAATKAAKAAEKKAAKEAEKVAKAAPPTWDQNGAAS